VDLRPPSLLDRLRTDLRMGPPPTYWLTRFVILRLLGLVYFFAFLAAALQIVPLVGHDGLTPADGFLEWLGGRYSSTASAFGHHPTLFWFGISDGALAVVAWVGVALSAAVALGFANSIAMFVLWALYLSIVHVGQIWYGYGWEILLLEAGFLAIFLVPLVDPRPFPRTRPPPVVIWLYRWLAFRIMLGAGLIKLRGSGCWVDMTCLDHHYETQPIPNPLSPYLHAMPHWFHVAGILYNHLCELVLPIFIFSPWRRVRHVAGALLVVFQLALIISGNLSFLNWLTIVPILACFDDSLLRKLSPRRLLVLVDRVAQPLRRRTGQDVAQDVVVYVLLAIVAVLSIDPALNLVSERQAMNRSYDPFSLVNTYGAFGSVSTERFEIILEGTRDEVPGAETTWLAYELPCKPGDPHRRPCIVSPYQPRLDWQMWFAAQSEAQREPWFHSLVWKLLHNDRAVLSLFANDPFPDGPPRWIRAELYRYHFTRPGESGWWRREYVGLWFEPTSAADPLLQRRLRRAGLIR
jgi:hypothetical protein